MQCADPIICTNQSERLKGHIFQCLRKNSKQRSMRGVWHSPGAPVSLSHMGDSAFSHLTEGKKGGMESNEEEKGVGKKN